MQGQPETALQYTYVSKTLISAKGTKFDCFFAKNGVSQLYHLPTYVLILSYKLLHMHFYYTYTYTIYVLICSFLYLHILNDCMHGLNT